jgi:restriction system protein
MSRKNELEEILEESFKYPIIGLIISIIFAGIGFYLSNKSATPGTAAAMTSGVFQMLGKFLYMLAGITLFFSALGYIVGAIKKKNKSKFFAQKQTLFDIKRLTWREFEEFVGHFFEKMGYRAEVTGGLNDEGIDLVVHKDGKAHFVQCKKYREKQVTLSMMRDFYGAMAAKGSREKGFFVTTGDVTLEAGKFAEGNSIEVINGPSLMDYLNTFGLSAPEPVSKSKSNAVKQQAKTCPECGAAMVVRVARKGAHENKPFWGCSNYPKCRTIVPYTE